MLQGGNIFLAQQIEGRQLLGPDPLLHKRQGIFGGLSQDDTGLGLSS